MENPSNIFENGAIWVRADFHLHTRADAEFQFSGDPNFFAAQYIQKLIEQEINIAVITNHNKFDCTEFKELRKNALKKDIYLLPGIELSVKDGAKGLHILIVFDDPWIDNNENHNYIQDFITSAFAGINGFDRPEYKNSNFTFKEACSHLEKFGREYFIVMAHVDDSSGLFCELQGRGLEDFLNADCFNRIIAFQKVRNRDILKKVQSILKGRLPCIVEGTDSAHKGIDGIGGGNEVNGITQKTFIKIGAFSFEALKFALIDCKNRVAAQDKPKICNAYIKSISFAGGLLDQKKVSFSPELNSLIGIRGSGKSSILEILRYSLNIPLGNQAIDRDYKNSLIEHGIKSGGKVILILINEHGEEYRIERIYGQKEDIYQNNILKTGINIDAIFKTPVYFGQKDLSNKDIDFEAHLIHTLIGTRLLSVQQRIWQKKGEIEQLISEIQKLRNLQDVRKETEATIANSNHQLELFKKNGVEEKLKQQTHFDRDISVMGTTSILHAA